LSQLAHHFALDDQLRLFQICDRLARLGVIVSDLRRTAVAAAGFWVGSRLLRFDPATRADGITSIRRGFTDLELRSRLEQVGIAASVVRRPWFRLLVTWRVAGGR
jgi:hypothetical protein